MTYEPYKHPGEGTEDYMCPNCCTPWRCNGPHISDSDLPAYNEGGEDGYWQGQRDMLAKCIAAVEAAVTEWESEWSIDDIYRALRAQQEKP